MNSSNSKNILYNKIQLQNTLNSKINNNIYNNNDINDDNNITDSKNFLENFPNSLGEINTNILKKIKFKNNDLENLYEKNFEKKYFHQKEIIQEFFSILSLISLFFIINSIAINDFIFLIIFSLIFIFDSINFSSTIFLFKKAYSLNLKYPLLISRFLLSNLANILFVIYLNYFTDLTDINTLMNIEIILIIIYNSVVFLCLYEMNEILFLINQLLLLLIIFLYCFNEKKNSLFPEKIFVIFLIMILIISIIIFIIRKRFKIYFRQIFYENFKQEKLLEFYNHTLKGFNSYDIMWLNDKKNSTNKNLREFLNENKNFFINNSGMNYFSENSNNNSNNISESKNEESPYASNINNYQGNNNMSQSMNLSVDLLNVKKSIEISNQDKLLISFMKKIKSNDIPDKNLFQVIKEIKEKNEYQEDKHKNNNQIDKDKNNNQKDTIILNSNIINSNKIENIINDSDVNIINDEKINKEINSDNRCNSYINKENKENSMKEDNLLKENKYNSYRNMNNDNMNDINTRIKKFDTMKNIIKTNTDAKNIEKINENEEKKNLKSLKSIETITNKDNNEINFFSEEKKILFLGKFNLKFNLITKSYLIYYTKIFEFENLMILEISDVIKKEIKDTENKVKGKLLWKISDEFKTPLNNIIGIINNILVYKLNEHIVKEIILIHSLTNFTIFLVNDVIYYSNESDENNINNNINNSILMEEEEKEDHKKINFIKMDISTSLFFSFDILYSLLSCNFSKKRNISIKLIMEKNIKNIKLFSDENKINQMLINFLTNSLKFTKEGMILILAEIIQRKNGQEYLRISCVDSGIGISNKIQELIFSDDLNIDINDKFNTKGNGIGLSLCKKIAKTMNIMIEYCSKENIGSEFSMLFPIKRLKEDDLSINTIISKNSIRPYRNSINQLNGDNMQTNIIDENMIGNNSLDNFANHPKIPPPQKRSKSVSLLNDKYKRTIIKKSRKDFGMYSNIESSNIPSKSLKIENNLQIISKPPSMELETLENLQMPNVKNVDFTKAAEEYNKKNKNNKIFIIPKVENFDFSCKTTKKDSLNNKMSKLNNNPTFKSDDSEKAYKSDESKFFNLKKGETFNSKESDNSNNIDQNNEYPYRNKNMSDTYKITFNYASLMNNKANNDNNDINDNNSESNNPNQLSSRRFSQNNLSPKNIEDNLLSFSYTNSSSFAKRSKSISSSDSLRSRLLENKYTNSSSISSIPKDLLFVKEYNEKGPLSASKEMDLLNDIKNDRKSFDIDSILGDKNLSLNNENFGNNFNNYNNNRNPKYNSNEIIEELAEKENSVSNDENKSEIDKNIKFKNKEIIRYASHKINEKNIILKKDNLDIFYNLKKNFEKENAKDLFEVYDIDESSGSHILNQNFSSIFDNDVMKKIIKNDTKSLKNSNEIDEKKDNINNIGNNSDNNININESKSLKLYNIENNDNNKYFENQEYPYRNFYDDFYGKKYFEEIENNNKDNNKNNKKDYNQINNNFVDTMVISNRRKFNQLFSSFNKNIQINHQFFTLANTQKPLNPNNNDIYGLKFSNIQSELKNSNLSSRDLNSNNMIRYQDNPISHRVEREGSNDINPKDVIYIVKNETNSSSESNIPIYQHEENNISNSDSLFKSKDSNRYYSNSEMKSSKKLDENFKNKAPEVINSIEKVDEFEINSAYEKVAGWEVLNKNIDRFNDRGSYNSLPNNNNNNQKDIIPEEHDDKNPSPSVFNENQMKKFNKFFLIVDDNLYIRRTLVNLFSHALSDMEKEKNKKFEYGVLQGEDGVDALRILTDGRIGNKVKALFIDENMNYLNGSESVKIIRQFQKLNKVNKFKIASVTAFEDVEIKNNIKKSGMDEVFSKPLKKAELINFLDKNKIVEEN